MKKIKLSSIAAILALALLLSACGGNNKASNSSNTGSSKVQEKEITLNVLLQAASSGSNALPDINARFTEQNPNIKINIESVPADKYDGLLKTRLASGDAPDLFGIYAGKKNEQYVDAGHLMDLSDQPWVNRMSPLAKKAVSVKGEVIGLPRSLSTIGVIYNKKVFNELNLDVPQNWDDFLMVNQAIKDSGKIPIAIGLKDLFVSQLVAYAMAPSAIYRENPDFDYQMEEGKQTFVGSAWEQMLTDYQDLNNKGYFNDSILGTGLDGMLQMMSTEEAAMIVAIGGYVKQLRSMNPDLELGMFPLPYAKTGEEVWVSANVAGFAGVSSQTKHPEEAKKYLAFLAEPENYKLILGEGGSAFTDVESVMDPAQMEMLPYMEVGTYQWLDAGWPSTVQPTLFNSIQELFIGNNSIEDLLKKLDEAFNKG